MAVKFGIDLYSIRSLGWTPFQYLDYCARWKASVVHFSEVRLLGGLDDAHLARVREHAAKLGVTIEIGMRSICPTAKHFDPSQGSAEEQLARMIQAAAAVGSPIVRAFLGTSEDRLGPVPIESHIDNTVQVLRRVRSRALDAGNPLWALEDPHLTLETLAPYVLTSHIRDSAVWRTPEGAAVRWVRMGEGNVGIADYLRRYIQMCPGRPLSLEIIVTPARFVPYLTPGFGGPYRGTPAWEFSRFLSIAERGAPLPDPAPVPAERAGESQREDLEASIGFTHRLLEMASA